MSESSPRVWFITGASSGFGRAIIEVIVKKGDIAVATLRSPSDLDDLVGALNTDRLLVLKCDVTRIEDISSAFAQTIKAFGRCGVVFNNAGSVVFGEAESVTPDDQARAMFEVNFWGAANVSKEAVRVFRECNPPKSGGRLLNVSSGSGFIGHPAISYYAASKHALEGFTECLSKEIDPSWNIKISIIAPSTFKTRMLAPGGTVRFPAIAAYEGPDLPSQKLRRGFVRMDGIAGDPFKLVRRIVEFSEVPQPPLRWAVGKPAIVGVRTKLKSIASELDAFENWSDDLELVAAVEQK